MTQLPLMVPTAQGEQPWPKAMLPLARTDDPATSKQAATEMAGSKRLGEMQQAALALVKEYPGSTAGELGVIYRERFPQNFDSRAIGRRLRELERADCVTAHGKKRDYWTRKDGICWWPK